MNQVKCDSRDLINFSSCDWSNLDSFWVPKSSWKTSWHGGAPWYGLGECLIQFWMVSWAQGLTQVLSFKPEHAIVLLLMGGSSFWEAWRECLTEKYNYIGLVWELLEVVILHAPIKCNKNILAYPLEPLDVAIREMTYMIPIDGAPQWQVRNLSPLFY